MKDHAAEMDAASADELASAMEEEAARWQRETRGPFVAEHPERREEFLTQALKWPVNPLYTPADLEAVGFDRISGR